MNLIRTHLFFVLNLIGFFWNFVSSSLGSTLALSGWFHSLCFCRRTFVANTASQYGQLWLSFSPTVAWCEHRQEELKWYWKPFIGLMVLFSIGESWFSSSVWDSTINILKATEQERTEFGDSPPGSVDSGTWRHRCWEILTSSLNMDT